MAQLQEDAMKHLIIFNFIDLAVTRPGFVKIEK